MPNSLTGTDRTVLAELGERLCAARLRRNMSQQQLAREAGVGRMTVQRIEEGESGSLISLVRILRALGELEGLQRLLPPAGPGPLEEARRRGRPRQRARASRKQGAAAPAPAPGRWRWGDERKQGDD